MLSWKSLMREEFPKSGENALNPEVSVEAGTELPKKKVDSNVTITCPCCHENFATSLFLTIPLQVWSVLSLCIASAGCTFTALVDWYATTNCGAEVSKHSTTQRKQTKMRSTESITSREAVVEHFIPDSMPPTKKPHSHPSTNIFHYFLEESCCESDWLLKILKKWLGRGSL